MKKILPIIITLNICVTIHAVTPYNGCPDFMNLTGSYVEATIGYNNNPFLLSGVIAGRHTLITAQGTDPNTGGALRLLPPGENRSIKLGNEQAGAEAEAITYHFIVDRNNPVLQIKFAVVLENYPGLNYPCQSRFYYRISDKDGNLLENCTEQDISAAAELPDFQTYNLAPQRIVRWRDWVTVGVDMSRFIGEEVQVQFVTYDSRTGTHFSYIYFTAACIPNVLPALQHCSTGSYTVEAPEGFASYLWDNGDQTHTSTRPSTETNKTLTCIVTSITGCRFTLYANIVSNNITASSSYRDTICEGDTYNKYNFDLPPQFETGEKHYYNTTYLNLSECAGNITDELTLVVLPRYNRFEASICYGENYTENGFNLILPAVGVRYDTLIIKNGECDVYHCLKLTVNQSLNMPNAILGNAAPCVGEQVTYSFAGGETMSKFEWELPSNVVVVRGRNSSQVTLYFTNATPANIILKGENGCGTGQISLAVRPNQDYNLYFSDNICAGSDYNNYGFRLSVFENEGYFLYTKELKTVAGCDSMVTLALSVSPVPEVAIALKDSVLCNVGETVTLLATNRTFTPANLENIKPNMAYIHDCDINYLWSTGETGGSISPTPLTTTTYTVTATTSSGCSATASQTVVVNAPTPQVIDAIICEGETYNKFGFTANTAGTHTQTLLQPDCSVPLTLNLTVNSNYQTNIYDTVCYGVLYQKYWLNRTFYQEGSHIETIRYLRSTGCDSIVYLNLQVSPVKETTINDFICQNELYNKNGFSLSAQTATGTFTHSLNLTTAQGCDSIVYLNLQVNPIKETNINDFICQNEPYNKNGFSLPAQTATGTFTHSLSLTTAQGCDSIVYLNLQVNPVKETNISDFICQNEPYNKSGFSLPVQTVTGTFSHSLSLTTAQGCDSIVHLNLQVNPVKETNIDDFICQNQFYNKNGFSLPAQTIADIFTYSINLTTTQGCDSIVYLRLRVNPIYQTEFSARIEVDKPYNQRGFDIFPHKSVGKYDYEQKFIARNGCDSLVILHLTVYDEIYPDKFFRPNSGGRNDHWTIKNIEFSNYCWIYIYDRFGKLLRQYNKDEFISWDGMYLGKPMPSTDYWYLIQFCDGRIPMVGHFTLLR